MGRCSIQEQDNIPPSPQGANHAQVDLKFLLIALRRVMEKQATVQTYRAVQYASFVIANNRDDRLCAS